MFLLITRSRFPFYSFYVKVFPQSICHLFNCLINTFITLAKLPVLLPVLWCRGGVGDLFSFQGFYVLNFALGRYTYPNLPNNMIQSSKYLLKSHYVLGTGNTKLRKMGLPVQWGNRQVHAGGSATMGSDP